MKKRFFALIVSLILLLAVLFAFSACSHGQKKYELFSVDGDGYSLSDYGYYYIILDFDKGTYYLTLQTRYSVIEQEGGFELKGNDVYIEGYLIHANYDPSPQIEYVKFSDWRKTITANRKIAGRDITMVFKLAEN